MSAAEKVPEKGSKSVAEKGPEKGSQSVSEKGPERGSQSVSEKGAERGTQSVSEKVPERGTLILVRNAECEWNELNLFCGWYDSPVTPAGLKQIEDVVTMIKKKKLVIETCHASLMDRAKDTASGILEGLELEEMDIQRSWRLNPKHYGALTSWNKNEIAAKYGEEQTLIWRRSWSVSPPSMDLSHQYYYEFCDDPRYSDIEELENNIPITETLKQVLQRVLPYWTDVIGPELQESKTVLVVSHCNPIRALIKHLDGTSEEDLLHLHIPNAIPFSYEIHPRNLRSAGPMRYLADEATVQKRIDKVIQQGKVL